MIHSPFARHVRIMAWAMPCAVYAVASLLILGPALAPGYLLMMDMFAVPHPVLGSVSDSTFLLSVLNVALSHVMSSDVVQKVTLGTIFWLTGLGAHLLARRFLTTPFAAYSAGLFYVFNPAVYERFFYGQWLVILGWGALPWILLTAWYVLKDPHWPQGLAWGLLTGMSISWAPHSVFYLLLLVCSLGVALALSSTSRSSISEVLRQRRLWSTLAVALLALLLIVLPWLLPTFSGHSGLATYLSAQTTDTVTRETSAYATQADPLFGTLGNVLAGYGFWAESAGRFISPKTVLPLWPLYIVILPALSVLGLAWRWWRGDHILALALALAAPIAVFLALGVSSPVTEAVSTLLYAHVPLYSGLRDAQKWIGLLLLTYAYLVSGAADALLSFVSSRARSALIAASVICLLVPVLPGAELLFGGRGQLDAATYPVSWAAANDLLTRDMPRGAAAFLPWHLYLWLPFAHHVTLNPAPAYFTRPIVSSSNEELGVSTNDGTAQQQAVVSLLSVPHPQIGHLSTSLARAGICGIILVNTVDWVRYTFVMHAPGLRIVYRSDTLDVLINDDENCH